MFSLAHLELLLNVRQSSNLLAVETLSELISKIKAFKNISIDVPRVVCYATPIHEKTTLVGKHLGNLHTVMSDPGISRKMIYNRCELVVFLIQNVADSIVHHGSLVIKRCLGDVMYPSEIAKYSMQSSIHLEAQIKYTYYGLQNIESVVIQSDLLTLVRKIASAPRAFPYHFYLSEFASCWNLSNRNLFHSYPLTKVSRIVLIHLATVIRDQNQPSTPLVSFARHRLFEPRVFRIIHSFEIDAPLRQNQDGLKELCTVQEIVKMKMEKAIKEKSPFDYTEFEGE